MTTHTLWGLDGKRIIYTEYIVKTGETLKQVARDQLYDESRFNEILRWENDKDSKIPAGTTLQKDWKLLLPPVSEDFSTLTLSNPNGMNIRNSKDVTSTSNIIYKYNDGTKFPYKKSSLEEKGGLVWVKVNLIPPINDNAKPPVAQSVGWLCVKNGADFFTKEKIDKSQPFQG